MSRFKTHNFIYFSQLQIYMPDLKIIAGVYKIDPNKRNELINKMHISKLMAVKHLINNYFQGRIKLSNKMSKKLEKNKKYLYYLIDNKNSPYRKREILKKKGKSLIHPLISKIPIITLEYYNNLAYIKNLNNICNILMDNKFDNFIFLSDVKKGKYSKTKKTLLRLLHYARMERYY